MRDLLAVFPKRPVKILRAGAASVLLSYVLAALLLFILAAGIAWQVPDIMRDIEIQKNPVLMEDARLSHAKCKVNKGVFYMCSADVSYRIERQAYNYKLDYVFIAFRSGDLETSVVRSASKPELVTLSLGLDMLWNRIIVGLVFAALILAGAIALLKTGRKVSRVKSAQGKSAVLVPIAVKFREKKKAFGRQHLHFECEINGKKQRFSSMFLKTEMPFILQSSDIGADDVQMLAVIPDTTNAPVLMDHDLARLELTQAEREQIFTLRA